MSFRINVRHSRWDDGVIDDSYHTQFAFELGEYTISAVNGSYAYCRPFGSTEGLHFEPSDHDDSTHSKISSESETMEIAVMHDEKWVQLVEGEDVLGHVTPQRFAELLGHIAAGGDPHLFFQEEESSADG